uniref:TFIIS N-terminal domain-containing protein n=2 Tax=Aegilops tauschii subsp. strangulata TaxID=200361 RepID=A0A453SM17_AEGTS
MCSTRRLHHRRFAAMGFPPPSARACRRASATRGARLPLFNRIPNSTGGGALLASDWSTATASPGDISSIGGLVEPMAAQMLRRWQSFYGAFDPVDAAIEAADPDQFSRHVFRRARGDLLGRLCSAADDDQAERICGILDDVMAESLETLRLVPSSTPEAPVSTELAESVRALREHDSERVRLLARGIVNAWEASVQDQVDGAEVTPATPIKKLPRPKAAGGQQHASADPDAKTKRPPKLKRLAEIIKKASDPAASFVDGDRAGFCSDEKMEAAKRKLRQGYQEAEDAKRRRRTQLVQAPKMMQPASQRQPITRCTSSMVKNTFSVRTQLHMA